MTLQELYASIEGNYEQACRVLRIEKLIDKHIRKLPDNPIFQRLFDAADAMNPTELFESAHAIKGVCGNLGLTKMASFASTLSEEFRPGNSRRMSDDEVRSVVTDAHALYEKTKNCISAYIGQAL